MEILDGTKVAKQILEDLKNQVEKLKERKIEPCLGIILVGNRKDSESYVRMKKKRCQEVGITNYDIRFPENVTEEEILQTIERMNKNDFIHGILVQLPLPSHINTERIISSVSVEKDVDGFHPTNFGNLSLQRNFEKNYISLYPGRYYLSS